MTVGRQLPFAFCAFLCICAAGLRAQESDIPPGLKDKALSVTIRAIVMGKADAVAWKANGTKATIPGIPVGVKLMGSNVAILVQLTPYEDAKGNLVLVTQSQVWVKRSDGELSYFTSLDTVNVRFGEVVLFFPLGRNADGGAAMRVEVTVDHYADPVLAGQGAAGK